MNPYFSLQNLSFSYNDKSIFNEINLEIQRNEVTVISGENGTGKTTLCKILFGLLTQYKGNIAFEEKDFLSIDQTYITSKIAYIQEQTQNNLLGATPNEDLAIWQHKFQKKDNDQFKETRDAILKRSDIKEQAEKPIWALSAGQQKRVVLASLLFNKEKFWILDDPLFSLDSKGINILLSILAQHKLSGSGACIATQRPKTFSLVADRIYEIKDTTIEQIAGNR